MTIYPPATRQDFSPKLRMSGAGDRKCLIIGDSWANIPGLEVGFAKGIEGVGFTYGYSGKTSSQIREIFRKDLAFLKNQTGIVDAVIFLVGVNDLYLHTGARAFGRAVRELRILAKNLSKNVLVVEIPRVSMANGSRWWGSILKRTILRLINDFGEFDPISKYRIESNPEIEFDGFISSFVGNEHLYQDDGLHLKAENYLKLGYYIGSQVSEKLGNLSDK